MLKFPDDFNHFFLTCQWVLIFRQASPLQQVFLKKKYHGANIKIEWGTVGKRSVKREPPVLGGFAITLT